MDEPEVLAGGGVNEVIRCGNTVRRPAGPWTPLIHDLLRHLRQAGFTAAPAPHGITTDGFEILDVAFMRAQAAAGSAAFAGHLAKGITCSTRPTPRTSAPTAPPSRTFSSPGYRGAAVAASGPRPVSPDRTLSTSSSGVGGGVCRCER